MSRLGLILSSSLVAIACSDDGLAPGQSGSGGVVTTTVDPADDGTEAGGGTKLDLGGGMGSSGSPPDPTGTGSNSDSGPTTGEEATSGDTGLGTTGSTGDTGDLGTTGTTGGSDSGSSSEGGSSSGGMMAPCPDIAGTSLIGGPADLYGYCWYLTAPMDTCDSACAELVGGANLAAMAESSYPDHCDAASDEDVSTWFFNNGNPGGWVGTGGGTAAHTLGYGYSMVGTYYGKCSTGGVSVGTYPGEPIGGGLRSERQLVCACAVGSP